MITEWDREECSFMPARTWARGRMHGGGHWDGGSDGRCCVPLDWPCPEEIASLCCTASSDAPVAPTTRLASPVRTSAISSSGDATYSSVHLR